ncbi:MAG: M48 family metallopeptidase, partial [Deltaproteobacteria bacterium]|nr:M48 family metallopeptidase [Deltaproteobacteria bacterium]
ATGSLAYTQARGRLALAEGAFETLLTLVVLFSGFLPALDGLLAERLQGAHLFAAYLATLMLGLSVAGLPFGLYSTFVIEARFGFNRTTFGVWLLDRLKGLLLAAALGLPLLYATHWFMSRTGPFWWLWLFGFYTGFQVLMVWIYPTLIAPLFNRFRPLPQGEFRTSLEELAQKAGFRTGGLYIMDASRRSGHSNAYFTGFFRPRIVLFDTLVEKTPLDESLAVLAHEIGHYKARHVYKRLGLGLVQTLGMLYVLSLLADWPPLFLAFGFSGPSFQAALALLVLCGGSFTFFLTPFSAGLSRRHEFQADAFAVRLTGRPQSLVRALARLGRENLSNLNPHPLYSSWHYSHPALTERLEAIGRLEPSGERPS